MRGLRMIQGLTMMAALSEMMNNDTILSSKSVIYHKTPLTKKQLKKRKNGINGRKAKRKNR